MAHVSLTPHLEEFIQEEVNSGRYSSPSEVMREALRLLEDQKQRRFSSFEYDVVYERLEKAKQGGPWPCRGVGGNWRRGSEGMVGLIRRRGQAR